MRIDSARTVSYFGHDMRHPNTRNPRNIGRITRGAEERYWQATVARDRRADGTFVLAVRSTGIYCRPSCPARRPLRRNVVFFRNEQEAEGGGFRACLRCRPNEVAGSIALVQRAAKLLFACHPPIPTAHKKQRHDDRSRQRSQRRTNISPDLKQRLCQARPAAGGHPRYPRRLGMKHRRSYADDRSRQQEQRVIRGHGEQQ